MITDGRTGFRTDPGFDRDFTLRPEAGRWQRTFRRVVRHFGAYLRRRRAESWLFFAAGYVVAAILT